MSWQDLNIFFQIFILLYFIAINGSYSLLTLLAYFEVRGQYKRSFIDDYHFLLHSKIAPGVSLLVPAYNEEATIIDSIKSLLLVKYPKFEIIIINDGSTDRTLDVLKQKFKLQKIYHVMQTRVKTKNVKGYYISSTEPNLVVIDKVNGQKADSLNAGINAARYQYFIALDADVILEDDALLRLMRPMLQSPKTNLAAGGIIRVVNDCVEEAGKIKEVRLPRRALPIFQVIEYIRAFTAGRAGFAKLNSLMIVSGAFGVFNTGLVRELGGFEHHTVGEDMELLVRIHRHLRETGKKYKILFRAYPVSWTEVPESLKVLGGQRNRWHRGLTDTLWRHKKMLFNPRYGRIGLFGMPFFFLFEFLGPFVELFGYLYFIYLIVTGLISWPFFLLFLALAILWGVLLSVSAVLFEDLNFKWYKKSSYIARLILYAVLENLGYRQLTVLWRISGLIDYLRGKQTWGAMPRRGFQGAKGQ